MCVCVRVCHFNPFNPCSPATTISVCLRFEINFWIMTELWYFPLAGKATSGRGCLKRRGAGRRRCTRSFNYLFWAQKIETTNKQTNDGSENLQHSHDLLGGAGWGGHDNTIAFVCGNRVWEIYMFYASLLALCLYNFNIDSQKLRYISRIARESSWIRVRNEFNTPSKGVVCKKSSLS